MTRVRYQILSEALSNLRHGNAPRRSISVIGLSIAWRLARRGLSVADFERGTAGSGASLTATGMLAAAAEHEPGCHDLPALAVESQRQWRKFRGKLEAQSGYDIDFRECGTLVVALNRDEVEGCDSVMICTSDAACQLSIWPDGRFVSSNLCSTLGCGWPPLRPRPRVDPRLVIPTLRRALLAYPGAVRGAPCFAFPSSAAGQNYVLLSDELAQLLI